MILVLYKYIKIYFYDAYFFLYKTQALFYPKLNTMNISAFFSPNTLNLTWGDFYQPSPDDIKTAVTTHCDGVIPVLQGPVQ